MESTTFNDYMELGIGKKKKKDPKFLTSATE